LRVSGEKQQKGEKYRDLHKKMGGGSSDPEKVFCCRGKKERGTRKEREGTFFSAERKFKRDLEQ